MGSLFYGDPTYWGSLILVNPIELRQEEPGKGGLAERPNRRQIQVVPNTLHWIEMACEANVPPERAAGVLSTGTGCYCLAETLLIA